MKKYDGTILAVQHATPRARVDGCTLLLTTTVQVEHSQMNTNQYSVLLKTLDIGALEPGDGSLVDGWSSEGINIVVRLRAAEGSGVAFARVHEGDTSTVTALSLQMRDRESGVRVGNALRRVATLCGARRQAF